LSLEIRRPFGLSLSKPFGRLRVSGCWGLGPLFDGLRADRYKRLGAVGCDKLKPPADCRPIRGIVPA
jgi:hypothetical protein